MTPKYSIVIPIYNEEETIGELYQRLEKSLSGIDGSYEVIFVNDGSKDNSLKTIREIAGQDSKIKALDLSRNFGLQPAYSAGIDHALGEAVYEQR